MGESTHGTRAVTAAEIVVDLAAIRHNVRLLRELVAGPRQLMTVVKADGYGHGMVEPAGARPGEAGADWLGVATIDEALALRAAGDTGPRPLLARPCRRRATSPPRSPPTSTSRPTPSRELDEIERPPQRAGVPARVQLKVDTGLSRGGAPRATTGRTLVAGGPRRARTPAGWRVTGVWSHLACATSPTTPPTTRRRQRLPRGARRGASGRARPEVRHLANSAGAILRPAARLRPGRASAGDVRPRPGARRTPLTSGCVPAMTVRAPLVMAKPVARRRRGLLRPHLGRRHGHHRRPGAGRLRRRGAAACQQPSPRCGSPDGVARSAAGSAWTSSSSTSRATSPSRGAEVVLFGPGDARRAHRAGLGGGMRHHQLRDRDAGSVAGWRRRHVGEED